MSEETPSHEDDPLSNARLAVFVEFFDAIEKQEQRVMQEKRQYLMDGEQKLRDASAQFGELMQDNASRVNEFSVFSDAVWKAATRVDEALKDTREALQMIDDTTLAPEIRDLFRISLIGFLHILQNRMNELAALLENK